MRIPDRFFFKAFLAALLVGGVGQPGLAADPPDVGTRRVEAAAEVIAKAIKKTLSEKNRPLTVGLGQFSGTPILGNISVQGFGKHLKQALERIDVKVTRRAGVIVSGQVTTVETEGNPGLRVVVDLKTADLKSLGSFGQTIAGASPLAMAGVNFDLPAEPKPGQTPAELDQERKDTLRDEVKDPKPQVEGGAGKDKGTVRPAPDSRFGMQILVRRGQRLEAQVPEVDEGLVYVELFRGEEFSVRLTNDSKFEAAVLLTLDGVSMFATAEDGTDPSSMVIVKPDKHVDVPGWFITKKRVQAFKVIGFPESVAADLGQPQSEAGVVTALFHPCWDPADPPPFPGAKGGSGIGRGRELDGDFRKVRREIGKPLAAISIRYER